MQSTKLVKMVTLSLVLASPLAAMAGDSSEKLACPAGTKQSGSKAEGLFCRKAANDSSMYVNHGPYVEYHSNGAKAAQGEFSDGFKSGVWTFYDESGHVRGTTEFKKGNYHGQRTLFFPSGKPRLIEEYQNGSKHGLTKELSEDGKVVNQVRYENNRVAKSQ
ncbi:hypothetical protein LY474_10595 [Myxococcus stipitatus]|uniref:toxin-antitoxin system YwqK family antitoxin n=1 Tax=Myxococcus stipitatus TaxID=83455 RepID=UPI001F36C83E|nr:hypothetical protein [Myxococcus stipitatus]MCE9668263.1 hypothetical protein [Myxococcus stipitatus]